MINNSFTATESQQTTPSANYLPERRFIYIRAVQCKHGADYTPGLTSSACVAVGYSAHSAFALYVIRHCYFFYTLLVASKSELEPETSTFVNIVTLVNYYIMFNNESGLNVLDVNLLGFISGLTAQSHSFNEEIWSSVQHV